MQSQKTHHILVYVCFLHFEDLIVFLWDDITGLADILSRLRNESIVELEGTEESLPARLDLGAVNIPTAVLEKLHCVMVNTLSWDARQMDAEEALRLLPNAKVAPIDLCPGLLYEDGPEELLLGRATEGRLMRMRVDWDVVIDHDRRSQAIEEELDSVYTRLVDLFRDQNLLDSFRLPGQLVQVRQDIVMGNFTLLEIIN